MNTDFMEQGLSRSQKIEAALSVPIPYFLLHSPIPLAFIAADHGLGFVDSSSTDFSLWGFAATHLPPRQKPTD